MDEPTWTFHGSRALSNSWCGEGAHSCSVSQEELAEEEKMIRVAFTPERSSTIDVEMEEKKR